MTRILSSLEELNLSSFSLKYSSMHCSSKSWTFFNSSSVMKSSIEKNWEKLIWQILTCETNYILIYETHGLNFHKHVCSIFIWKQIEAVNYWINGFSYIWFWRQKHLSRQMMSKREYILITWDLNTAAGQVLNRWWKPKPTCNLTDI